MNNFSMKLLEFLGGSLGIMMIEYSTTETRPTFSDPMITISMKKTEMG